MSDRHVITVLVGALVAANAAFGAVMLRLGIARVELAVAVVIVLALTVVAGLAAWVLLWWRDQARIDARLDAYESDAVDVLAAITVDSVVLPPDLAVLDGRTVELPVVYDGRHRAGVAA